MWHSEADILKDLISLNDFGVSGKDESCEVLYSFGRGLKTKGKPKIKKNSFPEPKSVDSIDLNDILEFGDTCSKGKGRGSALGFFPRSKYQLQKQLRLARPFGSSDLAIEAFYRKNIPVQREENTISTSDSNYDAVKNEISNDISRSPFNSLIENMRQKVKATRNSKLQHNVLINNLLSRGPNSSDLSSVVEKLCLQKSDDNGDGGDGDDDDDDDEDNGIGKGNSSMTASLCRSFDVNCTRSKTTESDFEKYDSDTQVKVDNMRNEENIEEGKQFALIDTSDKILKRSEIEYKMKLSPRIIANFSKLEKQTNSSAEIQKRFGERFSTKNQLCKKRGDEFGERLKHLTSRTADSFNEAEHSPVNWDDFPPLRRNIPS